MNRTILLIIIALSLTGLVDSGYALYQHYSPAEVSSCDVNEVISCTAVNQSSYSVILGIPVAAGGIAAYALFIGLAVAGIMGIIRARLLLRMLAALAAAAMAFSLWLTYVEIFILGAVCPLCVVSLALVTGITVAVGVAQLRLLRSSP